MALWRLSRTLIATEGCVAEARMGSVTSPNSSKPPMVSMADVGAARDPPAAMVKLYETDFPSSLLYVHEWGVYTSRIDLRT
jgi:hypothetical protein